MTPSTNVTRLVRVINFTRRFYINAFLPHAYTVERVLPRGF